MSDSRAPKIPRDASDNYSSEAIQMRQNETTMPEVAISKGKRRNPYQSLGVLRYLASFMQSSSRRSESSSIITITWPDKPFHSCT